MKEQADWNNQSVVDEAADAERAERECTIDGLKAYWVAKRLGIKKPGGGFYSMVDDWKARRLGELAGPEPAAVFPPDAEAELGATFDRMKSEGMTAVVRIYREYASQDERKAAALVADSERRYELKEEERKYFLEQWIAAEKQRDAALAELDELQIQLLDGHQREARLEGRIDQLMLDQRDARRTGIDHGAPGSSESPRGTEEGNEMPPIPEGLREAAELFETRFLDSEGSELPGLGTRQPHPAAITQVTEPVLDQNKETQLSRAEAGDPQVARTESPTKPEPGESGSSSEGENGNA